MFVPFLDSFPTLGVPYGACGAELSVWVSLFPAPCHATVLLKVLVWIHFGHSILKDIGLSLKVQADAVSSQKKDDVQKQGSFQCSL